MSGAIIDACCFINLYATRDVRGFLSALKFSWHVSTLTLSEAIFVRASNSQGNETKEAVDAQPYIDEGLISLVDLASDDEVEMFVRLAAELDDGEAMALAIAKQRSWMLATDDRKAKRFAINLGVAVITTPELVRRWVEADHIPAARTKVLVGNIESGARFSASEDSPDYDWWASQRPFPS